MTWVVSATSLRNLMADPGANRVGLLPRPCEVSAATIGIGGEETEATRRS